MCKNPKNRTKKQKDRIQPLIPKAQSQTKIILGDFMRFFSWHNVQNCLC